MMTRILSGPNAVDDFNRLSTTLSSLIVNKFVFIFKTLDILTFGNVIFLVISVLYLVGS